jgi:hydroxyethylthiazole kinase
MQDVNNAQNPYPQIVADLLTSLRSHSPLVQCITNYVSMDIMANCLLAMGASPAMAHEREEVVDFLNIANSLSINIGTLSMPWIESMVLAAKTANQLGKPWVLDPVGCGATPLRTNTTLTLLAHKPRVVRANASEIMAIMASGVKPKGVDALNSTSECHPIAHEIATRYQTVVAVTGEIDLITDGQRTVHIHHGHPLMTKVTALGCTLSSTIAALTAITDDPFEAAIAGITYFGLCGERAAVQCPEPGSFRVAFIDHLHRLTRDEVCVNANITSQ